ncbi:hypothetical protein ODZ84_10910 [Chryseobacterium fluminis]|uniref:hypothetical protein n=1 Tax=Chryseobacterium fluminis TaxID=2983606 RepID=UPI00224D8B90|nr:hypothetical protein [Chryseobacterium sp. MMS21-Ot14]UZU00036.1 hypothetical protein ODZ84_10910 [Chryseobacterium sp. MMS21-Ot14]
MKIKTNIYNILLILSLTVFISCNEEHFNVENDLQTNNVDYFNRESTERENSDSEYISGVKMFSRNYKDMLIYITENAESNDVDDLNKSILDFIDKRPNFVDPSLEINFLQDPHDLNSSTDNLSQNLNFITNHYSSNYDEMALKLEEYTVELEQEKSLNRREYLNANLVLSIVQYINENDNNRFGFYTTTGKSKRACLANVIGAGVLGAGIGCWGGVKAGAWFGLQSAAAGCAIGAAFMGVSSALAAYGTNANC